MELGGREGDIARVDDLPVVNGLLKQMGIGCFRWGRRRMGSTRRRPNYASALDCGAAKAKLINDFILNGMTFLFFC